LAHVLAQMIRYNHRDRYQTATEALQAVQQLAHGRDPTRMTGSSAVQLVHELTLEWYDAGLPHSRVIQPHQSTRHLGAVRIGRDPTRCDVVLSDITVSGLHVEIFFNPDDQHFYVRNLRTTNPPVVDGRTLPQGERVLNQESRLQLGQVELKVTTIVVREYSSRSGTIKSQASSTPIPMGQDPGGLSVPMPVPHPPPPVPPSYRQELVGSSAQNAEPFADPAGGENALPFAVPSSPLPLATTQPRVPSAGWPFWLFWAGATALSSAIAASAFYLPSNFLGGLLRGAIMGGCVGIAQWLILRQWIPTIAGWILASVVAQTLSFSLVARFPQLLIAIGVLPGIAQWFILRGKTQQTTWWIPTKAIADPLGLLIGFLINATVYPIAGGIAGLVSGVITGGVMMWLLQQPRGGEER
jgi:serine/threonine-protein kinase